MTQVNEGSREKTGLGQAKEKPHYIELPCRLYEAFRHGESTPSKKDARHP